MMIQLLRGVSILQNRGALAVCMANIFAYRAKEPKDMKAAKDPVGEENNEWLSRLAKEASLVIGAWVMMVRFCNVQNK